MDFKKSLIMQKGEQRLRSECRSEYNKINFAQFHHNLIKKDGLPLHLQTLHPIHPLNIKGGNDSPSLINLNNSNNFRYNKIIPQKMQFPYTELCRQPPSYMHTAPSSNNHSRINSPFVEDQKITTLENFNYMSDQNISDPFKINFDNNEENFYSL
jgi:hypothetical protein